MSPSEVIIEVYIMPEDASLVLFLSVERLLLRGEKNVFISLPLYNSGPGWAPWPCHVRTRPRDHGGDVRELEGVTLNSRCAICS